MNMDNHTATSPEGAKKRWHIVKEVLAGYPTK